MSNPETPGEEGPDDWLARELALNISLPDKYELTQSEVILTDESGETREVEIQIGVLKKVIKNQQKSMMADDPSIKLLEKIRSLYLILLDLERKKFSVFRPITEEESDKLAANISEYDEYAASDVTLVDKEGKESDAEDWSEKVEKVNDKIAELFMQLSTEYPIAHEDYREKIGKVRDDSNKADRKGSTLN